MRLSLLPPVSCGSASSGRAPLPAGCPCFSLSEVAVASYSRPARPALSCLPYSPHFVRLVYSALPFCLALRADLPCFVGWRFLSSRVLRPVYLRFPRPPYCMLLRFPHLLSRDGPARIRGLAAPPSPLVGFAAVILLPFVPSRAFYGRLLGLCGGFPDCLARRLSLLLLSRAVVRIFPFRVLRLRFVGSGAFAGGLPLLFGCRRLLLPRVLRPARSLPDRLFPPPCPRGAARLGRLLCLSCIEPCGARCRQGIKKRGN